MRIKLLGCGVFEPELRTVIPDSPHEITLEAFDAGLHETPGKLRETVQEAIDRAAIEGFDAVALAYGLCGRGTSGLIARGITVVVPRVHDCLTLFLGSREEYRRQFRRHPGTYYLTPGWFTRKLGLDQTGRARCWTHDVRDHPRFDELAERYGEREAAEIVSFLGSWKRNYTRVAVIDTGCDGVEECVRLAERIAAGLDWECERIDGDTELLRDLVRGNWDDERFLVLRSGQRTEVSGDERVLVSVSSGVSTQGEMVLDAHLNGARSLGERSGLGLGIDAGGTYTDAVVYDFGARDVLAKAKAPTTHHNPLIGIRHALDQVDGSLLSDVRLVALSTTLATNAIVENRGGRPGCIIMPHSGFDESRVLWENRAITGGKMSISGEEIEPFDRADCRKAVLRLLEEGVDAFAVSGYGSTRNPAHELAARAIIRRECDLPVVCGHELSGKLNFLSRANTAALNARLLPLIDRLLEAARLTLAERGIEAPLMIVKGDGSLINLDTARRRPVETVLSGPAASALGAWHLAEEDDAMVVDVGGTTTDLVIISEGRPRLSDEGARVGGWQTCVEAARIRTSGLGGDSALDFDADRELLVGPRRVIPLCYLASITGAAVAEKLNQVPSRDDTTWTSAGSLSFYLPGPMAEHRRLSEREARILQTLSDGPMIRGDLAQRLEIASPSLLNLREMEDRGVLARSGLTPTDLLHYEGEFRAWDVEAARAGIETFAEIYGCTPRELIARLRESITRRLALMVLSEQLGDEVDLEAEAAGSETLSKLVGLLLSRDGAGALSIDAQYHRPVVGIGAPAEAFLRPLEERLGSTVVVPEHAEVANAVGAIISQVEASEVIAVRPSEYDAFMVYALGGRREFESLSKAASWAAEEAARVARERAVAAGAAQPRIEVDVDQRTGKLANGEQQVIEVRVRATAVGHPSPVAAT